MDEITLELAELESQIEVLDQRTRTLKDTLLIKMIEASGLKERTPYVYNGKDIVHIVRFELKNYGRYDLRCITNKVNKDGTFGKASHSSWGVSSGDLKEIK